MPEGEKFIPGLAIEVPHTTGHLIQMYYHSLMERVCENTAAIIGISMLNPHFTRENIQRTASEVRFRFSKLIFMLPDAPACHTLYGYGYTPEEAGKTVKRKFSTLERSCRECIEALSLNNARIMRWDEVEQNVQYQESLLKLERLRAEDVIFREDVRTFTRAIYENSQYPQKRSLMLEDQIERGSPFLIQELAFMIASADIGQADKAVHIYHRDIPFLSSFIRGRYKLTPPSNLDFEIVA